MNKKYVLVDLQLSYSLSLVVAFEGEDNIDQVLCSLSEKAVVDLMRRENFGILPDDMNIDIDVKNYINKKYHTPTLPD